MPKHTHKPTPEEERNLRNIRETQRAIEHQYKITIDRIFNAGFSARLINDTFRLTDNPSLERKIVDALSEFRINVNAILVNGINMGFEISQSNFTNLLYKTYDGRAISDPVKAIINATYEGPLKAFLDRSVNGLKLSDRVWNMTRQFQKEIEWTIFAGLSEGQSAQTMSRSIRRFLKNPNALFRRVRDSEGRLVLSRAAKAFHPGQGVYRSSYKNAMRVSRTEVNTAYRTADHEKYKSIPFVLGIEVRLSDQHVIFDICDIVAGIYPPWFKFTGWHIQCICYQIPVLPPKEEFDKYQRAVMDGTDKDFVFKGKVEKVPKQAFDWVMDNKDRIERWKHLPTFMKDNPGVFNI